MPIDDERIAGAMFEHVRAATPAEARANKNWVISLTKSKDFDARKHTASAVLAEECKYAARMFRAALDVLRQADGDGRILEGHTGILEGDIGPLEVDTEPQTGGTYVSVTGSEQRIVFHYGDRTPHHAAHVIFRQDVYPNKSNKPNKSRKPGMSSEPVYSSGEE